MTDNQSWPKKKVENGNKFLPTHTQNPVPNDFTWTFKGILKEVIIPLSHKVIGQGKYVPDHFMSLTQPI